MPTASAEHRHPGPALLFLLAAGVALVLLWYWLAPAAEPVPAAPAEPVLRVVAWQVQEGRRVHGPDRVSARAGERLRLQVRSDRDDELHIHGYELRLALVANQSRTLELDLTRSGRFEVELHRAHLPLTVLEVQPR